MTDHTQENFVVHDVKQAMQGFVEDFKQFRHSLDDRLAQQQTHLRLLDQKSRQEMRPVLGRGMMSEKTPYEKAFSSYIRKGDEESIKSTAFDTIEQRGLSVVAEGGVLADPQTASHIETVLRSSSSLRQLAKVVQVESMAFDALIDHTQPGAEWISETSQISETTSPKLERISINVHELSATPKASQRLLDDAAFNVEDWLAERIASRFVSAENMAFIMGDGQNKPKGILSHSFIENAAWGWGRFGYVTTGQEGGFTQDHPADTLIDLVYSLGVGYRANAHFVMNSRSAGDIRKLKDADGRYVWTESLSIGQPARLLGYPVLICEEMPDIAADNFAIAFGDFRAGYTIVERPDLRILRDPYSAKPHVLFYATKRVGGDVTDFSAIKFLKFAA